MSLDYNIWQEHKGGPWYWEVVNIPDDGGDDEILEQGIADSRQQAKQKVGEALRRKRVLS